MNLKAQPTLKEKTKRLHEQTNCIKQKTRGRQDKNKQSIRAQAQWPEKDKHTAQETWLRKLHLTAKKQNNSTACKLKIDTQQRQL